MALLSSKMKAWFLGQLQWKSELKKACVAKSDSYTIWLHCASLGEFEQAKPVLEAIRKSYADRVFIYLSFFSPSGYLIRKNEPLANAVGYLPLDTPQNANDFLDLLKPQLVLLVKYEFWPNYLDAIYQRKIYSISFSSIFRKNQIYFSNYFYFLMKGII